MDNLTPEESEALIESVARGIVPDGDDGFAHALTAAHIRPGEPKTAAPSLAGAGGSGMSAGGFMRRTAVGATVGLISLVGVAAAGTAGVVLFASNDAEAEIAELGEEDDVPTETTITTTTTIAASDDDGGEDDSDRERGDEIEGVDSSDGLDDEELALLCEAAVNHGEYVSSVAKDKAGREEGESPGARVSEAARTDCGKSDTDDDDDVDDEAEEAEDDEDDEDDTEVDDGEDEEGEGPPSHVDGPGNGQGKAKGHSKNGKGNGDS